MLSKDLGYVSEEIYNNLVYSIEGTSFYLNAYCKGIIENNGLRN